MPDHYSPSLFLQQIPNKLLKEYFTRRGEPIDLDWDSLTEGDVLPILDAWHGLSLPQQADIEHWFRTISSLATKDGLKTVIEECKFHELELPEVFNNIPGIHEKVFWIFLQKENVILSAGRLNRADHLYSRYWRRRNDLPAEKPDLGHSTRKELEQAISTYYKATQNRGAHCAVQVYLRREKIHYFFAYPSNYADTAIIYDENGVLQRQVQQAAFEVIFAYNEDTGCLDDFMHGDKNLRRDLEEIFCRIVLKEKLPDTDPRRPPYQIDAVRKANIDFPTNPEDKIRETRVKFLRLSIVGPGFGRITFESDAWRKKGDIHELMKTYLNADSVSTTRLRKRHP